MYMNSKMQGIKLALLFGGAWVEHMYNAWITSQ